LAKLKAPKKTPEELKKAALARKEAARRRQHVRAIKDTFLNCGFEHLTEMSSQSFTFKGKQCDFDDVFILDNVVVVVERTAHNEKQVSSHLVNKSIVFGYIRDDQSGFASYIRSDFPEIKSKIDPKYSDDDVQVRIVYCSLNPLKTSTKEHVPFVRFLDNPQLRYFLLLSRAIRLSARYELLDFLGVAPESYAQGILSPVSSTPFQGMVLPEAQSHLPKHYKVVSFYASAEALIRRAYVLRRDSWRVGSNIYQRVLLKKKIDQIRKHLLAGKGAFLNNIVVALPSSSKVLDDKGNQIDTEDIKKVRASSIQLTNGFNSLAVIDGQHRIYSYHEGGIDESAMAVLRQQQNLLVTGIILPSTITAAARDRFCAGLFLQINSSQTKAKPELIQDIGVILRPFAVGSVARRLLWKLNERGPLADQFQTAFAEGERVKTASIVNYGLIPLIRPGAEESLFRHWDDESKLELIAGQTNDAVNEDVIDRYVDFCTVELNKFIGAVKVIVDDQRWTPARSVPDRLLTTTIINGMIHCVRRLSATDSLKSHAEYRVALEGIGSFDFGSYTSSHYSELGLDIAKQYFGV